jgi:hypothetical protein
MEEYVQFSSYNTQQKRFIATAHLEKVWRECLGQPLDEKTFEQTFFKKMAHLVSMDKEEIETLVVCDFPSKANEIKKKFTPIYEKLLKFLNKPQVRMICLIFFRNRQILLNSQKCRGLFHKQSPIWLIF